MFPHKNSFSNKIPVKVAESERKNIQSNVPQTLLVTVENATFFKN
jgi:hypothetical protein